MDRNIPRRDFIQGALAGAAVALTAPLASAFGTGTGAGAGAASAAVVAAQDRPGYYPPLLTGMRGSHPGSFETAHALRDGAKQQAGIDTGETYDLIVVGGGISGLAAAHFFRAQTVNAGRILILDNHDDFGGHAKRNEFSLSGRMQLLNGGTLSIESPRPYSAAADKLIKGLGIDVAALSRKTEHLKFYDELGLKRGVFFDRETFGTDKLVADFSQKHLAKFLADSPLPEQARRDVARIEAAASDFLPGMSSADKKLHLSKISYQSFLRDAVHADEATIAFYQARTHGWWGVGIDAVSALDCWGIGMPGFKGMNLKPGRGHRTSRLWPVGFQRQSSAFASQQHGDPCAACRRSQDGAPSGGDLSSRRPGVHCPRERLRPRVLEHDDSLSVSGIAGGAKGGAARLGENSVGVHQRRAAQLAVIPQTRHSQRLCPRVLSHQPQP
jgi:spermidine dehydrogenase